MKRMSKIVLALALVLSMVLPMTSSFAEGETEIVFWNCFTSSDGEILRQVGEEFNKKYAGKYKITMDMMDHETFVTKLATSLSTGDGPDIVSNDIAVFAPYVEKGLMRPVTELLNRINKDDYAPGAFGDGSIRYVNGELYYIPIQFHALHYVVDVDAFAKIGIDFSNTYETFSSWEDWYNALKQLTDKEKQQYGFEFFNASGWGWYTTALLAGGGKILDTTTGEVFINSPENINTLTWLKKIMDECSDGNLATMNDSNAFFLSRNSASTLTGAWQGTAMEESGINYKYMYFPYNAPTGAKPVVQAGACDMAVTNCCDDETYEAVLAWFEFWLSDGPMKTWSVVNGFAPFKLSVANDPEVQANPIVTAGANMVTDYVTFMLDYPDRDELSTIICEYFDSIMIGDISPEEGLAACHEEVQAALSRQLAK